MMIKLNFLLYFILAICLSTNLVAHDENSPSNQINEFGESLQTVGAPLAFQELFAGNPNFKNEQKYIKDLRRHYEYLIIAHGEIEGFNLVQDKTISDDTRQMKYISDHNQGQIVWDFKFCDCEGKWLITDIYFEKQK